MALRFRLRLALCENVFKTLTQLFEFLLFDFARLGDFVIVIAGIFANLFAVIYPPTCGASGKLLPMNNWSARRAIFCAGSSVEVGVTAFALLNHVNHPNV